MKPIDEILQKLNDYQRQAVLDESPAALVNAGVGSGKTTVLTAKVLYLHFCRNVPLEDMVVITFTNKAADEIRERLAGCPKPPPWLGTFHSVALRMLQTVLPVESLGYTPTFTLIDPDELLEMAAGLIAKNGLKIKYLAKLAKRLESYAAGRPLFGAMKSEDDIGLLADLLRQEKLLQNRMDFDDLLQNAARLQKSQGSFAKWVIVDEFQDCDALQLSFIRALAGADTRVFAVGDPGQSIYGWRGGRPEIFAEFKKEFAAKEFSLPVNYRSSATILEAAKSFLQDGAALTGVREPGCKIRIQNHYNAFMEADALAGKIKSLHEGQCIPYGSIAVLYRLQAQSKNLADAFLRAGIPYEVSVRKTLQDIPVLQWLARLLKSSVNPDDRGSLISALTHPGYGPGVSRAKAEKIAANGGHELYDKIKGFSVWAAGGDSVAGIEDYFGLDAYLSPTSVSYQNDKDLVRLFLNRLSWHIQKNNMELQPGLADFLNSASLHGSEMLEDAAPADAVRLMTLHACKGLEFRYVFIIGINYGLVPLLRKAGAQDGEEEKRLFFVGITRAMDFLELSYYSSPEDQRVMPGESPYLCMIPPHLAERGDQPAALGAGLHDLRRALMDNRRNPTGPQPQPATPPAGNALKKVRHPKYGEGYLESEDENTITAVFEQFGKKSFSKDFCPLEFL